MKALAYGLMGLLAAVVIGSAVYSYRTYGCFAKSCHSSHNDPVGAVTLILVILIGAALILVGRRMRG
jgi:hypothetical protein